MQELNELIMALDYFDYAFGQGEELGEWKAKMKEELEQEQYPFVYESDKPKLKEFLQKCITQLG